MARCTVKRLMGELDLYCAVRGRKTKTTVVHRAPQCPADRVNRNFRVTRPSALWGSDLTYVATWRGFVYVAFVIDAYARRIVGWRASNSLRADLRDIADCRTTSSLLTFASYVHGARSLRGPSSG